MMLVLDLFVVIHESSLLNNFYQNQFTDEYIFVHEKSFFFYIVTVMYQDFLLVHFQVNK